MTQTERIIRHLQEHGSITSAEAMQEYGIYRLASRICDIKKAGVPVVREFETSKNRYGESVTYARYRLEETTSERIR